jgi:hypothetical protein
VSLVGESYGAYQSAIVAALDAESPEPVLSGKVTLLAPPIIIEQSMNTLDDLLDKHHDDFFPQALNPFFLAKSVLPFLRLSSDVGLTAYTRNQAEGLVVYSGFYQGLLRMVHAYSKNHPEVSVPNRVIEHSSYVRWASHLRFGAFLKQYDPQAESNVHNPDVALLSRWLERHRAVWGEKTNLRVITADDDILNRSGDWKSLNLPPDELIVLSNGGHLGYGTLPWFKKLFLDPNF